MTFHSNFEDVHDDMLPYGSGMGMWGSNTPHYPEGPGSDLSKDALVSSSQHGMMHPVDGRGQAAKYTAVDWKKQAKFEKEHPELAQELRRENKKRLSKLLGPNSDLLQYLADVANSAQGNLAVKTKTGQEIHFVEDFRTGRVTAARFLTDEITKQDVQLYVEALESSGIVANPNSIVASGSVKFQGAAAKAIRELQAERFDAVNNHFVKQDQALQTALKTGDFESVGMQGKTAAAVREKQQVVNALSSSIASGRLSSREIGYLYRMTEPGSKTLAAAKNSPTWEYIVALAGYHPKPQNDNGTKPAIHTTPAQQRQGLAMPKPKVA